MRRSLHVIVTVAAGLAVALGGIAAVSAERQVVGPRDHVTSDVCLVGGEERSRGSC